VGGSTRGFYSGCGKGKVNMERECGEELRMGSMERYQKVKVSEF
jgi:hypothetical protein